MDHATLIDSMAERVGTTKVQARKFFDELVGLIRGELQSGGNLRVNDLGTFSLRGRAPRKGTAPGGQKYEGPARKTVTFKPASNFRRALNLK